MAKVKDLLKMLQKKKERHITLAEQLAKMTSEGITQGEKNLQLHKSFMQTTFANQQKEYEQEREQYLKALQKEKEQEYQALEEYLLQKGLDFAQKQAKFEKIMHLYNKVRDDIKEIEDIKKDLLECKQEVQEAIRSTLGQQQFHEFRQKHERKLRGMAGQYGEGEGVPGLHLKVNRPDAPTVEQALLLAEKEETLTLAEVKECVSLHMSINLSRLPSVDNFHKDASALGKTVKNFEEEAEANAAIQEVIAEGVRDLINQCKTEIESTLKILSELQGQLNILETLPSTDHLLPEPRESGPSRQPSGAWTSSHPAGKEKTV